MKQQAFFRAPFRSLLACLTVLALLASFGTVFALAGPEADPDTEVDGTPADPDTSAPDTSVPDDSAPDTSAPDDSDPDTSVPDDSDPDTSDPDDSDPDTSDPDDSDPDTSAPDDSDPAFSVTLKATGDYYPGGTVSVTATVDGMTGDTLYTGFFFDLTYDPAALTLANQLNTDNSLDCVTSLPGDRWENLTTADPETGTVRVSVGLTEDMAQATKENGSLVLTFRFTVPETVPETTALRVPEETVSATDVDLRDFPGAGATLTLTRTEAPELSSSEPPAAGDAGSVFPFLLGTGALLGLFTAIRLRRRGTRTL